MLAPLSGEGQAIAEGAPAAVFAYLAQPRHAPEWFASLPPEGLADDSPAVGQRWLIRQGRRLVPMVVAEYDAPRRFAWRTERDAWHDNLSWAVEVRPMPRAPARCEVAVSITLSPGPLGQALLFLMRKRTRLSLGERAQRAAERAVEAFALHSGSDLTQPRRSPHMRPSRRTRPRKRPRT